MSVPIIASPSSADLTRKVTMQNLFHDGGFSSMGMSYRAIEQYEKSFKDCPSKLKVHKVHKFMMYISASTLQTLSLYH
jgi:hypothetical protein